MTPAGSFPALVGTFLLSGVMNAAAALAAPATPPRCEPGGPSEIEPADLRAPGEDDLPLNLRSAVVTGSISAATLCGDGESRGVGPCLLPGEEPAVLASLIIEGDLDLSGTVVQGGLDLTCTDVRGRLDLGGAAILGPLRLAGARVGGPVSLDGALVTGPVEARGVEADGNLSGTGARLPGGVDLGSARLGGALILEDALVGSLLADEIGVRRGLKVVGSVVLGDMDLAAAQVGRDATIRDTRLAEDLDFFDADVEGPVLLERLRIDGDLDLAGRLQAEVTLREVNVAGDADISDAQVRGDLTVELTTIGGMVDLMGTRFAGAVRVSDSRIAEGIDMDEARFRRAVIFLRCVVSEGVSAEEAGFASSPEFIDCEPPGLGQDLADLAAPDEAD